ncbi:hypothetical protein BH10PSE17_BH10PSE17_22770 [soil metagenome]
MNSIGSDVSKTSTASVTSGFAGSARPANSAPPPDADSTSVKASDKSDKPASKPSQSPEALAEQLNQMLARRDSQIRFEIDRTTHPSQVITQIVDKETKEVLRQFPSEELIKLSENLDNAKIFGSDDVPLVRVKA